MNSVSVPSGAVNVPRVSLPCVTVLTSLFQISALRKDIREIRVAIKSIMGKLGSMDVELGKLMDKAK